MAPHSILRKCRIVEWILPFIVSWFRLFVCQYQNQPAKKADLGPDCLGALQSASEKNTVIPSASH